MRRCFLVGCCLLTGCNATGLVDSVTGDEWKQVLAEDEALVSYFDNFSAGELAAVELGEDPVLGDKVDTADVNCPRAGVDWSKAGPYQVGTTAGGLGYTVYYPKNMETSCKYPILAWGNGTGVIGTGVYAPFLNHLASHGFVTIASHSPMVGSGLSQKAGLDWLIQQNKTPGSSFFDKLNPDLAGTTGHSQGGIGALACSGMHPNVKTFVSVQGTGFGSRKPGLFLTGTLDPFGSMTLTSYAMHPGPKFLASYLGAEHLGPPTVLGVFTPVAAQFRKLTVGWFRCFLVKDQNACALFKGAPTNCGTCKEPGWAKIDSKNLF